MEKNKHCSLEEAVEVPYNQTIWVSVWLGIATNGNKTFGQENNSVKRHVTNAMTVSIALRQWSAIDENDQNCKGASTKPSSVTALSDRTIRCK